MSCRPPTPGRLRCWRRPSRLHTAPTRQPLPLPRLRPERTTMTLLRNLLLWILLAVIGATLAWMALRNDHGQVLVRYGGYDYTTTLVNAIAIGLAIVLVLWLACW